MVVTIKITPSWAVRCLSAVEDFLESGANWRRAASIWTRASAATVGFTLCATATADYPLPARLPDHRLERLEKFFKTYHCPTPYHTSDYLRAADGYGLDYRLLPAVSIRESSCGIAERQMHNLWGYHPGHQSFPSIEAGIDFVAQRLAQHRLYRGKTLQDKLYTYNPRPAYPREIERIMRQIE